MLSTFSGTFPLTSDIWALPLGGERKPFPVIQTQFRESLGVSPPTAGGSATWLTRPANSTSTCNRFFAKAGNRNSPNGGRNPHWRADGNELFYLNASGTMTAVSIDTTKTLAAGLPKTLFPTGVIGMSRMPP